MGPDASEGTVPDVGVSQQSLLQGGGLQGISGPFCINEDSPACVAVKQKKRAKHARSALICQEYDPL